MLTTVELSPDELELIRRVRHIRNGRKPGTIIARVEESCITVQLCHAPEMFRRRPAIQSSVKILEESTFIDV